MDLGNNDLNKLARERAIEKIRKLLAMANDGRGNENEAAIASKQAEKMMRAYQVESADIIMKELQQDDAFDRGVEDVYFGPRDPRYMPSSVSSWVGVIAIGCGAAFTCKVDTVMTPQGVKVRFSGYSMDTALCRWVFTMLCNTVHRLSVENYTGKGVTTAKAFRSGAAGILQRRLFEIRDARNKENQGASNGTALVLYDKKAQRVAEMFGEQKTEENKVKVRDAAAYAHGQAEGAKINISTNRPLNAPQAQARIGSR